MKEKILELRKQGKSYLQIQLELKCSKGTIAYHCGDGQKAKSKFRNQQSRKRSGRIIHEKISRFKRKVHDSVKSSQRQYTGKSSYDTLGKLEFIKKCLKTPICYWTGVLIDLDNPKDYELDHYIPLSKGGTNLFSNIVLSSRSANRMKNDLLPDEVLPVPP